MVSRYHIYSSLTLLSAGILGFTLSCKPKWMQAAAGYFPMLITGLGGFLYLFSFIFYLHFYTRYFAGAREGQILYPNQAEAARILSRSKVLDVFRAND